MRVCVRERACKTDGKTNTNEMNGFVVFADDVVVVV